MTRPVALGGFDGGHWMTLYGPMVTLLVPEEIGNKDPRILGRAMLAWEEQLTRRQVKMVECWCNGMRPEDVQQEVGLTKSPYYEEQKKILDNMDCETTEQASAKAKRYGLGFG